MALFLAIAFGYSWFVDLSMILFHAPIQVGMPLMSLGPCIAALICHRRSIGNWRLWTVPDRAAWPRILAAAALGLALVIAAYVAAPGLATAADRSKLDWSILLSAGVYNWSTLLGGPLGEEPGWRGFLLPRLEERFHPSAATLILGLIWTAWHLPLFLVRGWTSSPLWIFAGILLGLSYTMTLVANLSGSSVIAAILTHAAFNTASRFLNGLFAHTDPVTSIPFEAVLAISGGVMALVLVVVTKGKLGYRRAISATA